MFFFFGVGGGGKGVGAVQNLEFRYFFFVCVPRFYQLSLWVCQFEKIFIWI